MAKERPHASAEKKSSQVLVSMTPSLYAKLEAVAAANQRRMGEMARLLLEAALDPDRGKVIREAMLRRTTELREAHGLDPLTGPSVQTEGEVLRESLNRLSEILRSAEEKLRTEAALKPARRKKRPPTKG